MGSSRVGLMLMLLVCFRGSGGVCPRQCACSAPTEVHCTFRALLAVPTGISKHVQRINFGFNTISHISDVSFSGLHKLELLMMHGNNVQNIPDGAFQDLLSLQVLKLSYNKLRVITGRTFSGLTGLVRLHLDHNRIDFIHPDAFSGLMGLRLLHLEANQLQQLHPATFSTFSLLRRFPVSTLKHLYLSENLLDTLPRRLLENAPQLENLFLYGNPWSCDCRMSWIQDWSARNSGVMKCKKDRTFASGQLCPLCASPKHLKGEDLSDLKEFVCSGPAINSPGNHSSHEDPINELLPIDRIKPPFGNISLGLSDEHGTKVDLICQILEPRESTKITWDYTQSSRISANVTFLLDVECPLNRDDYESFWRLLAYYSEVPVHLRREIMLGREPALSYRYKQDLEKDAYFYTGVRANVLAHPSWLMQPFVNIKLNRPYSSSKSVRLVLDTQLRAASDKETLKHWVMIERNNQTRTSFASVVGGVVEMDCRVLSSGNASVRWMFPDGSKVNAGFSSTDNRATVSKSGKLCLKSVEHRDTGVYYCVVELAGDVDVLPFRLSIMESSTPLPGQTVGKALSKFVGKSASLPCLTKATPDAQVNWIFPDGSVLSAKANTSRALLFPNGSLYIPYSQLNDNGYYKCVAMNQHGVDVLATKLTVMRRRGIEPLRQHPSRPQSAAGVSTKVKAFLEDVEEASGDDPETVKLSRSFINRRRGQNVRTQGRFSGNIRRRRPLRKEEMNRTALTNQRTVNNKNQMDPKKWADLLAKIRERTSTKADGNQSVRVDQSVDNAESSSGDSDASSSSHQTHTTPVEGWDNGNYQTAPPKLHTTTEDAMLRISDPTSGARYVMTEVSTENSQTHSGSVIKQSESETKNEPKLPAKTGAHLQIGGFDSGRVDSPSFSTTSTNAVTSHAPPSSTQSRAKEHWRRRFGGRRRIKFRRPFAIPPTRRSSTSTAGRVHVQAVTLKTDPRNSIDDRLIPETTSAGHVSSTTPYERTSITAIIPVTTHIYPSMPDESSSITPTIPVKTPVYSTTPSESTSIPPTIPVTTRIHSTTPTEGMLVHPSIPEITHIYPSMPDESLSIHPTIPTTAHTRSTTLSVLTSIHPTSSHIHPTVQRELTNAIEEENNISIPEEKTTYKIYNVQETTSRPTSAVSVQEYEDFISSSSEEEEDGSISFWEEMDEDSDPVSVHPTSRPGAETSPLTRARLEFTNSLTTAPPQANRETHPTEISLVFHSPKSHLMNSASATGNVTPTDKSAVTSIPQLQDYTLSQPNESFKEETINNQMSSPSTTEDPTESIISVGTQTESLDTSSLTPAVTTQRETNEIDSVFKVEQREKLNYGLDKHLIVSTASLNTQLTTTSINEVIPFTTQVTGTETTSTTRITTKLSTTTPRFPLPDNRIPFYSRNPDTNYIDSRHRGRFPNTNYRNPYYYSRNPSVNLRPSTVRTPLVPTSSAGLNLINNIKTNTTPVKSITTTLKPLTVSSQSANSSPTATSRTTQTNNQIQIPNSMNRQTSAVVLSQGPPNVPVQQMRPRITAAKLHTVTVNAGTDVHFPCESVGEPKPLLTWTKVSTGAVMSTSTRIQRFEVQSNGTFVISGVQLQDRGQYLCTARNVFGVDKMMVTLVVLAHMPRMTLPRHQDVTVHLGNTASLECRAHGLPTPNISWVLPDRSVLRAVSESEQRVVLLPNGTLQVKQTNYLDKGIYKCIASNAAGADMLSVRLQIAALPPVIQEQRWENLTVFDGRSALIHCSAKGSPSPAVRWLTVTGAQLRSSQFINSNLFVFPNGTLFIRNPTEKDSGLYECMAANSVGVAKRGVNLQVRRSSTTARITSTSALSTDVHYGAPLRLDCTATGSPSPRIIWRTPSKKLVDAFYSFDHRMKVFENGSLSISSVTERDEGDYLCVARNKMGDDYFLLKVKVFMKAAKIDHKSPIERRVSYGGALRVDCVASGLPNPEITWSLPDGTMVNSIPQSDNNPVRNKRYVMFDNGTLLLNEVGMKEQGDYTCYAENQIGKDEMKVHIKVLADAPIIRNNHYSVIRVPYGETAILNCSAKGEPTPTVTWMSQDDRLIEIQSNRFQIADDGTLYIHKTGTVHTGNYTCLARNVVGMDKKVVYVEVLVSLPVINGLERPGIIQKTVLKDQRVLLDCTGNGTPFPRIMWVFPSNIVLPAPYYGSRITVHRNGTLDIHAARMSDSVELVCIARSDGGEAKLQINLEVIEDVEKPRLRSSPIETVPLTNGKILALNCSITGRPAPEITWTLPNGTSLPGGTGVFRFHHRSDGTLVITDPSVSDVGHYRCVGQNSGGFVERTVMLESNRKPEILSRYTSLVSIVNGENLHLHCLSTGHPRLTWTLPNGVVLTRPQSAGRYSVLNNGTLTVQRTSVYDRGMYVCQTSNEHGSSSLSVSVIVIAYPPRITSGPAPVTYGRPGVSVELRCIPLATPKAEVVWEMPDGLQLKAGVQPRLYGNRLLQPQGSMVIQSPSARDNGVYRCTAKNVVGSDSRSTYVYVF